jgi:phosphonate transport system substrate-binding protein
MAAPINFPEPAMGPSRRAVLKMLAASLVLPALPARGQGPLLFGTTPVILDDQAGFLAHWQNYLEVRLRRPVRFVQRNTYREIMGLLLDDRLDCAWVCGYPYVRHKAELDLLAVPLFQGQPRYRSYLIVPADDHETRSIADLAGKVYAYSDPDSNSGWLTPQVELKRLGVDPAHFFRKSFFTWGHRKVVEAVAAGLAQGGSVDGYIWDTLAKLHPELTGATRVAWRSELFGFPPLVTRTHVARPEFEALREVLLHMRIDPRGRALLGELNLDGFEADEPALFATIDANWRYVGT